MLPQFLESLLRNTARLFCPVASINTPKGNDKQSKGKNHDVCPGTRLFVNRSLQPLTVAIERSFSIAVGIQ